MTVTPRQGILVGVLVALLVATVIVYLPGGEGDPYSSDPEERLAAIRSLAGNTDDESLKILRHLSDDSDRRVAFAAVKAIGKGAASESNREVLLDVLSNSTSSVARSAAAAALGMCPGADLRRLTETMLKHEDPMVRAGAAEGLAKLPGKADNRSGSKRPDKSRRPDRETVKARLKIILPPLIEALSDADPRVRMWAITAIKRNTGMRFDYKANIDPAGQRDKIQAIENTLRPQYSSD